MLKRLKNLKIYSVLQLINLIKLFIVSSFKKTSSTGYPYRISVEPTNYCNARCPLCPTGASQLRRKKGFMDMKLYKKMIDEVSGKTSSIILWNYGEPFLHPHIFEMIDYAKNNKLHIVASTNGYVFYSINQINKLANSKLDKLIVSIDGATDKTNAMYRKNVNYKKVISGLKKFMTIKRKTGQKLPLVEIQFIVMKHNQHEIPKIMKLAKRLGDAISLKKVNTLMVEGINHQDWLPDDNRLTRYKKNIIEKAIPRKQNFHNCPLVWYSIVVNYDGTINPCCYDYQGEVILGDLNNQKVRDVWTGKKMQAWRKSIIRDRRNNKICRNCLIDTEKWI